MAVLQKGYHGALLHPDNSLSFSTGASKDKVSARARVQALSSLDDPQPGAELSVFSHCRSSWGAKMAGCTCRQAGRQAAIGSAPEQLPPRTSMSFSTGARNGKLTQAMSLV